MCCDVFIGNYSMKFQFKVPKCNIWKHIFFLVQIWHQVKNSRYPEQVYILSFFPYLGNRHKMVTWWSRIVFNSIPSMTFSSVSWYLKWVTFYLSRLFTTYNVYVASSAFSLYCNSRSSFRCKLDTVGNLSVVLKKYARLLRNVPEMFCSAFLLPCPTGLDPPPLRFPEGWALGFL